MRFDEIQEIEAGGKVKFSEGSITHAHMSVSGLNDTFETRTLKSIYPNMWVWPLRNYHIEASAFYW